MNAAANSGLISSHRGCLSKILLFPLIKKRAVSEGSPLFRTYFKIRSTHQRIIATRQNARLEMQMTLIAHHQATAIIHPAKTSLDLPALPVGCSDPERTSALWLLARAPLKGGNRRLDAATPQKPMKIGAVVGLVRRQRLRSRPGTPASARDGDRLQRRLGQDDCVWLSAVHVQADGQTVAHHHHDFRALAPTFVLPTPSPLFGREQSSHPETLAPSPVCPGRPVGSRGCAQFVPKSHPATPPSSVANRRRLSRIQAANLPTHNPFSAHTGFRSMCVGRRCGDDPACSFSRG